MRSKNARRVRRLWKKKTLVVGPKRPVDGDSTASTKALLEHLRELGLEAYTLPTLEMYPQLMWILNENDIHPACLPLAASDLTTGDLQAAYDEMLKQWQPDEIVLVDGQIGRLGFDRRGVPVYTIDHHLEGEWQDDRTAFIQPAPSAGCLLIKHFGIRRAILAVTILTDTAHLRRNMPADAIEYLNLLIKSGVLTNESLMRIQQNLDVPRDPAVLRAYRNGIVKETDKAVCAVLSDLTPNVHREVVNLLNESYEHVLVVRGDGYLSMRTKNEAADLIPLATRYGSGGHPSMAAVTLSYPLDMKLIEEIWNQFVSEVHRR